MSSVWVYEGTVNGKFERVIAEEREHATYEFRNKYGVVPLDMSLVPGSQIICD